MLAALILTVMLWIVPGGHLLLLPLQYLDTHFHEMSHALASVFTGGSVADIVVRADGSGVTRSTMTFPTIVASAGYMGAAAMGAAIIAFSRDVRTARISFMAIGALITLEAALWLRGDLAGVLSGIFYIVGFFVAARYLDGLPAVVAAQFVGLQQCLAALQSVLILVNPQMLAYTDNDATIAQSYTGIPAIFWSLSWTAFGAILMVLAFRSAWKIPRRRGGSR
jgi:hypothetical protein